jgi:3'(2'), 5'-bisphosphate nucleotidase
LNGATADASGRLEFAVRVAREAGARVLSHYGQTAHETKAGGSPVTAADLASNTFIVDSIREAFRSDAILSEESADDGSRSGARRVWVVDPLDGTREFLAGNGEFSVMIGLLEADEPVLGVVYVPATGTMYVAERGSGAWVESADGGRRALRCEDADPAAIRMVGSRSHGDPLLDRMVAALGVTDVRPSGSVGIKCARIAEGERDLYIHPVPYLKEWDTCAPEVVLREAGGTVTDCRGRPLRYNKHRPSQPDGILACVASLHGPVLATIGPLYAAAAASTE